MVEEPSRGALRTLELRLEELGLAEGEYGSSESALRAVLQRHHLRIDEGSLVLVSDQDNRS
jgi:hypothetical protein